MPFRRTISYLRGTAIPDVAGFRFNDAFTMNGDVASIQVLRNSDGGSVGTATATTVEYVILLAQAIAQADVAVEG
jgi:hypothetical protein